MYFKASYDYFWQRTWPFMTKPVDDYEEILPLEDQLTVMDPALPDPNYEWSNNVTQDINVH
jgi:hypothetical protein